MRDFTLDSCKYGKVGIIIPIALLFSDATQVEKGTRLCVVLPYFLHSCDRLASTYQKLTLFVPDVLLSFLVLLSSFFFFSFFFGKERKALFWLSPKLFCFKLLDHYAFSEGCLKLASGDNIVYKL